MFNILVSVLPTERLIFLIRWKNFDTVKKLMENKLHKPKRNIRLILIDRAQLQHESRLLENVNRDFTPAHYSVFNDILDLATNHYSEIRIRGQELLGRCFRYFAYSYKVALPRLMDYLRNDNQTTHEQFKGALFVLLGKNGKSFLTKHCWTTFQTICPALLHASHSEKPSIVKTIGMLFDTTLHHFDTFTISVNINQDTIDAALNLWTLQVFDALLR